MKNTIVLAAIGLVMMLAAGSVNAQSIMGVWQITSQTTTGEGGKTRTTMQPSLYIFTKSHYSVIRVTSEAARAEIDPSTATADELRNVFVDSFVANGGKYDYKRGKLWIWPAVAKNPSYMRPASNATFKITIRGNTMTMTDDESQGYPVANPTTLTLKRIE